ncbi:MAG TPA: DUF4329 domain-containing protein [Phycisphaerae bacterium]|nr:DUF4329 domain-containing protein [Phycisphaerae bacterium]
MTDSFIKSELARAWRESDLDEPVNRHEEGGYIVMNDEGAWAVERSPPGGQSRVVPPPLDASQRYNGMRVVGTFHTHPNPLIDELGREWEQAPSESDRRWHRRRGIRGFVISRSMVYEIEPTGAIIERGEREKVL